VVVRLPLNTTILVGNGAAVILHWWTGRLGSVALKYDPRTWYVGYGHAASGPWYVNAGPLSVSVATVGGWR